MEGDPHEKSNQGLPPAPRGQPPLMPPAAVRGTPERPLAKQPSLEPLPRNPSISLALGGDPPSQQQPRAAGSLPTMPPWTVSPPGLPLALRPLSLAPFVNRDSSPRAPQATTLRYASPDHMDALEAAKARAPNGLRQELRLTDAAEPPAVAAAGLPSPQPPLPPPPAGQLSPDDKFAPQIAPQAAGPQLVLRPVRSFQPNVTEDLAAGGTIGGSGGVGSGLPGARGLHCLRGSAPDATVDPHSHSLPRPFQSPTAAAAAAVAVAAEHRGFRPPISGFYSDGPSLGPWPSDPPYGPRHGMSAPSLAIPGPPDQILAHQRSLPPPPPAHLRLPAIDPGPGRFQGGVHHPTDEEERVASGEGPAFEYGEVPLTGLPEEPIQVTVATRLGSSGSRRGKGSGGRLDEDSRSGYTRGSTCGLFNVQRYLAGRDCIHNGTRWMSRSHFEKVGGSKMAKWYRSIRVLPDLEPLGEWLERHGMPVTKGPARRSRKRTADSGDEQQASGHGADLAEGGDTAGSPDGTAMSPPPAAVPPASGSFTLNAAAPAASGSDPVPDLPPPPPPPLPVPRLAATSDDKFLQRLINTLSPAQSLGLQQQQQLQPQPPQAPQLHPHQQIQQQQLRPQQELPEAPGGRGPADLTGPPERPARIPASTGGTSGAGGLRFDSSYMPEGRASAGGAPGPQSGDEQVGLQLATLRYRFPRTARGLDAGDAADTAPQHSPRTPAAPLNLQWPDPLSARLGPSDSLPRGGQDTTLRLSSAPVGGLGRGGSGGGGGPFATLAMTTEPEPDAQEPPPLESRRRAPAPRLLPLPTMEPQPQLPPLRRRIPHLAEEQPATGRSPTWAENRPWHEGEPYKEAYREAEERQQEGDMAHGGSYRSPRASLLDGGPGPVRDTVGQWRPPYHETDAAAKLVYHWPRAYPGGQQGRSTDIRTGWREAGRPKEMTEEDFKEDWRNAVRPKEARADFRAGWQDDYYRTSATNYMTTGAASDRDAQRSQRRRLAEDELEPPPGQAKRRRMDMDLNDNAAAHHHAPFGGSRVDRQGSLGVEAMEEYDWQAGRTRGPRDTPHGPMGHRGLAPHHSSPPGMYPPGHFFPSRETRGHGSPRMPQQGVQSSRTAWRHGARDDSPQ